MQEKTDQELLTDYLLTNTAIQNYTVHKIPFILKTLTVQDIKDWKLEVSTFASKDVDEEHIAYLKRSLVEYNNKKFDNIEEAEKAIRAMGHLLAGYLLQKLFNLEGRIKDLLLDEETVKDFSETPSP